MLDKNAPLAGLSLASPYLSLAQVAALRRGEHPHAAELGGGGACCVFPADKTLEQALDAVCQQAIELVRDGARILILTDRPARMDGDGVSALLPIPMAMATGAVHQALVAAGLRTLAGLAVEAGDCRDIHHAAVLIGYGAGAVCPWLALETARRLGESGSRGGREEDAEGVRRGAGEGDVEDGHLGGGQLPRRAPVRHPGAA